MTRLLSGISELYTPFERFTDAALVLEGDRVAWVGARADLPAEYRQLPVENLGGRGVLPGLVDSHTHLVWAGSRVGEYVARSRGAKYEEILEAGGGIHSTVAATRTAGASALLALARMRASAFLRGGVTSLEIKSGYGLDTESEITMLRVARELGEQGPQRVTTTLLAHVPDPAVPRDQYVERFVSETIPEVAVAGLADAVDVFCDRGAFTLDEARRILTAAKAHGLGVKAHAEQLSHTGASKLVAELGGLSADHLELSDESDWRALAASGTVATLLPGAAVILGKPLPSAAGLRAAGVKTAIASDHNPGSSPLYGLLPALQLATALAGFSVEEALVAGTAHAADALGRPDWGRLEPGSLADFLVVDGPEALLPLYSWGHSRLFEMVIGGTSVWRKDG
ncbi:MAG: imidazolonepropionase [Trueperaceae bacterium]|nr:imidazolonepropionase [Trueperaceae bacterium]